LLGFNRRSGAPRCNIAVSRPGFKVKPQEQS
jgi:hypothetical protein